MFRTNFLKNAKLNYKFYSSQTVIVSNKSVKPYEIAESEEIDIRIVDEEKPNNTNTNINTNTNNINTNSQWGEATIYME
jgi:hypothetical protein